LINESEANEETQPPVRDFYMTLTPSAAVVLPAVLKTLRLGGATRESSHIPNTTTSKRYIENLSGIIESKMKVQSNLEELKNRDRRISPQQPI
jgi:hypothetical protein